MKLSKTEKTILMEEGATDNEVALVEEKMRFVKCSLLHSKGFVERRLSRKETKAKLGIHNFLKGVYHSVVRCSTVIVSETGEAVYFLNTQF